MEAKKRSPKSSLASAGMRLQCAPNAMPAKAAAGTERRQGRKGACQRHSGRQQAGEDQEQGARHAHPMLQRFWPVPAEYPEQLSK